MVKRRSSHEDSWTGLSLNSTNCQTASVSSRRSSRYWDEFANGKRTIDPTYCEKEIFPKEKVVSGRSRDSSAEIGFRTKTVVRDGKAVRSNTSSSGNILDSRDTDSYKGMQLFKATESPSRRGKGSSDIAGKLGQSQIATLPGSHRNEDSPRHTRKPSKKNISQITTLPGGGATPPPDRSTYDVQKCIMRNISSSVVVECEVGTPVAKRSPQKTVTPSRRDLASYETVGKEVYEDRRTKGNVTDRANRQTVDEVRFVKNLKNKPDKIKDLFAPTFRMF